MADPKKEWNYDRPFTRINSPAYDESRQPPDGIARNPDLANTLWYG